MSDARKHPTYIRASSTGACVYVIHSHQFFWAIAALHDETGLVAIDSDHGSWAHTWSPRHIGEPTLHHFVARIDSDYAAGKMLHSKDREELDVERTRYAVRERIAQMRLERRISREMARARWDEIGRWDEEDYWAQRGPGEMWLDDPGEYIRMRPTSTYRAFCEVVWPAVQKAVREELARREWVELSETEGAGR